MLPLILVIFSSQVLYGYERGVTPNPDILCNKHVKFGALFNHITKKLDAEWLATGHYARLKYSRTGSLIDQNLVG